MSLWASARAERVAPPLVALCESLPAQRYQEVCNSVRDAGLPFARPLANGVIIEQPYMIVVARKR